MGSPHVSETHAKSSNKRTKKKDAHGEKETEAAREQFVLPEGENYFPCDELDKSANLSSRGCAGEQSLKEGATTRLSDRVKCAHLSGFFKKGRRHKINSATSAICATSAKRVNVKRTPQPGNLATSKCWEVDVEGQPASECLSKHLVKREHPDESFDEGSTPFGGTHERGGTSNGRRHHRKGTRRDSPPAGKQKHIFCENLFYGQPTQGRSQNGKAAEKSCPKHMVSSINGLTDDAAIERRPSTKENNQTSSNLTKAKRISSVKLSKPSSDELTAVPDEVPSWEREGTQREDPLHVNFNLPAGKTNGDSPNEDDRSTPHGEIKKKFSLSHLYSNYLRSRSKWSRQLVRKNAFGRPGSRGSGGSLHSDVGSPARRPRSPLGSSASGRSTTRPADHPADRPSDPPPSKAANRNSRSQKSKLVKLFREGNNVYVKNLKICPREERHQHVLSNCKSAKIRERPILSLPKEAIPLSELDKHKGKATKNLPLPIVRTEKEDAHFLKFKNTWYELFFYTSSGGSKSRESLYSLMLMRLNFELLIQPIKDIILVDHNTASFSYPYIYNAYLIPPLDVHETGNSLRIQKATSDHSLINNGSWVFFKTGEKGVHRGVPTGGGVNGVGGSTISGRAANYLINMQRNRYFVDKCSFRCAKKSYFASLKSVPPLSGVPSPLGGGTSPDVYPTKRGIDPLVCGQPTRGVTLSGGITTEEVKKANTLPLWGKSLTGLLSKSSAKKDNRCDLHTNGGQMGNLLNMATTVKGDATTEESHLGEGRVSPASNSLFDCSCVYMTYGNSSIEPVFPYTCKNIFFLFQYYHNYLNGVVSYFRGDKRRSGNAQRRGDAQRRGNTQRSGKTVPPPTSSPLSWPSERGGRRTPLADVNNFKIRNFINGKLYDSVFSHVKKKNLEKVKQHTEGRRRAPPVPIFLWVIFGGKDMKSMDSLSTVYKILRYATEIPPSEYVRYLSKLERRKIKKNLHREGSEKKEEAYPYGGDKHSEAKEGACPNGGDKQNEQKEESCPNGGEQRRGTPKGGIPPEQEHDSANEFFPNLAAPHHVRERNGPSSGSPAQRGRAKRKMPPLPRFPQLPPLPPNIFFHKNLYKNATEIYNRIVTYYEQYSRKCDSFGPENYGHFLDYYRERVRGRSGDSEGEDAQSGGAPLRGGHLGKAPHGKSPHDAGENSVEDDDAYDFFIERSDSEGDELFDFISYHMQGRNPSFENRGGEVKEGKLNYTDIYGPLIYKKRKRRNPVRYSFLLLDYPAYNNSTGHPSPLTFKTSALAALKEALKELRGGGSDASGVGSVGDDSGVSSEGSASGVRSVGSANRGNPLSRSRVSVNILGYSLGCCVGLQLLLDIAKSLYNDFFQGESKTPFHRKEREPIREPPNEGNDLSIKLNSSSNNRVNEYVYDARKILTFRDVFVNGPSAAAADGQPRGDPRASAQGEDDKDDLQNQPFRKHTPYKAPPSVELHQGRSSHYCCSVTNYQQRSRLKLGIHKNAGRENAGRENAGRENVRRENVRCENAPNKVSVNESLQSAKQRKKELEKKLRNELNITVDRVVLVAPFTNTQKLVKSILSNSVLFLLSWFVMNKKCPYVHWDNISVLKEFFKILYDLKGTTHLSSIFANLQIHFIHGEKDTLVNYQMSLKLYKLTNTLTSKYALHHVKSFLYIFKEDCHSSIFNTEGENKILQIIFKPLRLHPFSTTNIHKLHFSLYRDIYLLKTAYLQYISGVTSKLVRA
ncbi:unnamed protein product [Plasmodium vivax]|uniref:(malaria parasite P. vivax) hypothetical protein n=1 Tax=Plasmodium vivax TaxID=5855 RepID=A0A8S4HFW2_PLAVI|nr:unnamed protein product [Plasmodium vivax]